MKCIIIWAASSILLGAALGQKEPPPGGFYTTRYDHLDVENILNQKRLVYYYSACILGKGPCTPQGIEFRRIMPEAIQTNCLRCTEKQRFVISRAIKRLKKEYPNIWEDMQTAWDPTGQKVKMFEQSLNAPRPNALPEAENEIVDRFGGNSPSTTTSKLLTSLLTSTLPPRLTPTTNSLPTRSVSQPQTTTTTTRTTRLTSPTLTTINHNYNHNVFLPNNAVIRLLQLVRRLRESLSTLCKMLLGSRSLKCAFFSG